MKAIVGIGNPGKEYQDTRHNIGFRVIDALKSPRAGKTDKIVLKKPVTFVNRTGLAVAELVKKHKLSPDFVLLVCDDVNLEFGKLRLRGKGSSGGHKGLQSVIDTLGTEEFPRLRIGVKNERMPKDLAVFVLEPFRKEEEGRIGPILKKAVKVCEVWAQEGFEAAMAALGKLSAEGGSTSGGQSSQSRS